MSQASDVRKTFEGRSFCICTPDFPFFVKNGGIGTSSLHTALWLRDRGARVTILFANSLAGVSAKARDEAVAKVGELGLSVDLLFEDADASPVLSDYFPNDIFTVSSYLAFHKLREATYDVVIFPDWRGIGYYSLFAKKQGLAFHDTRLWVQAHSTSIWHALNTQQHAFTELDLRLYQLERKGVELADALVSPTRYLLDWKKEHGFVFPATTRVLPLILPPTPRASEPPAEPRPVNELVFFGRLEKRKGLHIFLQALRRLVTLHAEDVAGLPFSVTFLGKPTRIHEENAVEFIDRTMEGLGIPYRINMALNTHEAQDYLKSRSCAAVILSVADNSPLTVHECMEHAIPFIASNVGGIPEIVCGEDHATALVPLDPRRVAERLRDVLRDGLASARPASDQASSVTPAWEEFIASELALNVGAQEIAPTDLISVCITHYERPALLTKTLQGLARQTYRNFETIIVDDGSKSAAARAFIAALREGRGNPDAADGRWPFHIELIEQANEFVGAARNRALQKARGRYIVFMDDDNYAHEKQLEVFLRAIVASGFDALSCVATAFAEHEDPAALESFIHYYVPLGCGPSLNIFGNAYGDANAIFRRSALDAVGGFTEDYALSWEDYELFFKLEMNGFRTGVVPFPLMYLRHTVGSVSRRGSMIPNHYRALRPALKEFPWGTFGDALLVAASRGLSASNFSFDPSAGPPAQWSQQLLRHSEFGAPAMRWLIRGRYEKGERIGLIEHLRDLVGASPALDLLKHELCYLTLEFVGREALANEGVKRPQAAGVVRALLSTLDGAPSAELLKDATPDGLYLKGVVLLQAGDAAGGLAAWSTCLDAADADYCDRHGDIARAVKEGAFLCGTDHYVRYGYAEGRLYDYCKPPVGPFARFDLMAPHDFFNRTNEAVAAADPNARASMLQQLAREIVECGCVHAAYYLARRLLSEARTQKRPDGLGKRLRGALGRATETDAQVAAAMLEPLAPGSLITHLPQPKAKAPAAAAKAGGGKPFNPIRI